MHSAERSSTSSAAESKMNGDSCAKNNPDLKQHVRHRLRLWRANCDRPVAPISVFALPPKCFSLSPPPPPPLRSRLSGSRNGVIPCCSEGRVGAVQAAGAPRCCAQEKRGEVRATVARRFDQPPTISRTNGSTSVLCKDRRRRKSPCVLFCLFLVVPLSFPACVCGPSGVRSAYRSVT